MIVLVAVLAGACAAPGATIGPTTPAATTLPPSGPSPATDPPPETTPWASPAQGTSRLLLRMQTCDDVCVEMPGTTILEDGRVIWLADWPGFRRGRGLLERRLTAEGLQLVRESIDATGLLDTGGTYEPVRTSAADTGHGFKTYTFQRQTENGIVKVATVDPDVFDADNRDAPGTWAIPEASRTLSDLGRRVEVPMAWLPETAWAEPVHAFVPTAYLLVIEVAPPEDGGLPGGLDVDAVRWPFPQPLSELGTTFTVDGRLAERSSCLPITLETAAAMSAAEAQVQPFDEDLGAMGRDLHAPFEQQTYGWARGPGQVTVTTRILLPDQPLSCEEGGRW